MTFKKLSILPVHWC